MVVVGVLGLAPCHVDRKIKLQVRLHSNLDGSSLAHAIQVPMGPLHYLQREEREEKRKEVLHLSRCYTHTHPQSRGNPERQEEEKKRTHDGPRPKTARGGRGTDGPPEPTYTAKRTWQNQSTHLNPTTHYGEASRRVNRDQWGLVGEKRNNKINWDPGPQTGLSS